VAQAEEVLACGAEKISINSPALEQPDLIDALSERFGAQCVVVGVDSQTVADGYRVQQFTGDVARSRDAARSTLDWVTEAQRRGAGEIVLNCMSSDGVRKGFDLRQLSAVRAVCRVPLVASGGAGAAQHFIDVFQTAHVDAALAASVFHSGDIAIPTLKRQLHAAGIEVRL
jgi:cyclase